MQNLNGKNVLLGVCGSIAAYKSAELIRLLQEQGARVRVVMTASAQEFITPLTLQTLSKHPVRTDLMDPVAEATMGHIELARWADLVLVAPATQEFMAKLVHGRAADLLSAICSVADVPMMLAPAMNHSMWMNAATQENRQQLIKRGIYFVGPDVGEQACGEHGPGRLVDLESLVAAAAKLYENDLLAGISVIVSAGPTREAIDPVRYLSNRSSGKMAYAIAEAAQEAGAKVTLVSGPVALPTPSKVERIDVISAEQMLGAITSLLAQSDIFVSAAAVADYRPVKFVNQKIKKDKRTQSLELERTPDILKTVREQSEDLFIVGFAAETENLEIYAKQKLASKGMNMIAANLVGEQQGFEQDDNALELFWPKNKDQDNMIIQHKSLEMRPKPKLARQLIAFIAERYYAKTTS